MYLHVGAPVAREDGRFYVPVNRNDAAPDGCSTTVFRVASDAFTDLNDAVELADEIIRVWNETQDAKQA